MWFIRSINFPTNMTFFTTAELLEIGDIPLTSILRKSPSRLEVLKYYRRVVEHYDLPNQVLGAGAFGHGQGRAIFEWRA